MNRRRAVLAALGAAGSGVTLTSTSRCGAGGARVTTPTLVFGSAGNIVAVETNGRGRRQLTTVPQGAQAHDPMWAPDAQRIAYAYSPPLPAVRGPGGLVPLPVTGVYTMQADGTGTEAVIPHKTPGVGYETPVWAPDAQSFFVTYTELVMESNVVKNQIVEVARVSLDGAQRPRALPDWARITQRRRGRRMASNWRSSPVAAFTSSA